MNICCYKPNITSYDFMRCLCATFSISGKKRISLDSIVDVIYSHRIHNPQAWAIFSDIEFRGGVNGVASNDIMESIGELQTFGLISKDNPKYEYMNIKIEQSQAKLLLDEYSDDIKKLCLEIVRAFN